MTQPVKTWAAKDPDAVFDYVYRIPLDPSDSVAPGQATVARLSGTVVIGTVVLAAAPNTTADGYGQDLTIWLSGGADGETSMFRVGWTTVGTRVDDALVLLPVVSAEVAALVLTGYVKPLPGHLMARYPAFASVSPSTVQAWLTDAERFVSTAWAQGDYAAGLMSLAAHNLALAGLGTGGSALADLPAGVSRFKSGTLDVALTDAAANARMSGGYESTRYGQEYQLLLRRNRGGPLVQDTGVLPEYVYGFGYPPYGLP
jgi:hypothetical protein